MGLELKQYRRAGMTVAAGDDPGQADWLFCAVDVREKAIEAAWHLGIPFIPVMAAVSDVELEGVVALLENGDKSDDWGQKCFLVSRSDVEVLCLGWISRLGQNEGISVRARFASCGTKDAPEAQLRMIPEVAPLSGHR